MYLLVHFILPYHGCQSRHFIFKDLSLFIQLGEFQLNVEVKSIMTSYSSITKHNKHHFVRPSNRLLGLFRHYQVCMYTQNQLNSPTTSTCNMTHPDIILYIVSFYVNLDHSIRLKQLV